MKKELIKLANHLDRIGLIKEADYIDAIIKKSQSEDDLSFLNKVNTGDRKGCVKNAASQIIDKAYSELAALLSSSRVDDVIFTIGVSSFYVQLDHYLDPDVMIFLKRHDEFEKSFPCIYKEGEEYEEKYLSALRKFIETYSKLMKGLVPPETRMELSDIEFYHNKMKEKAAEFFLDSEDFKAIFGY